MSTSQEKPNHPDHLRYELSQLEKMRQQIFADMETLRSQETNLRAFEARLRESQTQAAAATGSRSPHGGEALLEEWEKVRRSRTLLEAERRAFMDERAQLREEQVRLKQREDALRQREAWVVVRERDLAAKAMPPPPPAPPPAPKPGGRSSPFAAARNFLNLRRAS